MFFQPETNSLAGNLNPSSLRPGGHDTESTMSNNERQALEDSIATTLEALDFDALEFADALDYSTFDIPMGVDMDLDLAMSIALTVGGAA